MADDLFQNSSHNDVEKEKSSFAFVASFVVGLLVLGLIAWGLSLIHISEPTRPY